MTSYIKNQSHQDVICKTKLTQILIYQPLYYYPGRYIVYKVKVRRMKLLIILLPYTPDLFKVD